MLQFAITRDGVRVAYETTGRGPPLVLVHGLGDERSSWRPVCERLAPYFTCVTLDLRGHGQTTGATNFDPFALMDDVDAVIADANLRMPVLLGHSLGGFVVSVYAGSTKRALRAVVNVDQALDATPLASALGPYEARLRAGHVREVCMEVLDALGIDQLNQEQREQLARARDKLAPEVVLGIWRPFFATDRTALVERIDAALARIPVPYLAIFGRDDADEARRWFETRIAGAEIENWSGLGHYPHLVTPDRFVDRVRRLVSRLTPSGTTPARTR